MWAHLGGSAICLKLPADTVVFMLPFSSPEVSLHWKGNSKYIDNGSLNENVLKSYCMKGAQKHGGIAPWREETKELSYSCLLPPQHNRTAFGCLPL